ncbi:major facilitator superfamily transporter [Pterulicium gracile]|uniref:Major facilitator superfamily transporter n=1 Tax=Pterulicium gracile TaxID=1884261 RepID=A0A5C3QUX0_9AGAR|nr:major facilitator superfamily transporter [Pterula gracilis]
MSDKHSTRDTASVVDSAPSYNGAPTLTKEDLPVIDPVHQRKVLWKLDRNLAPVMIVIFLLSYLDRSNIGNAASAGLADDLGLVGTQLNTAILLFFLGYVSVMIPAPVVMRKFRPSRMIPALLVAWGTVVACGCLVQNFAGLCVTRVLLGVFESGIYPCLTLLLSTFYTPSELATRISFLGVAQSLSGAFGGLLAYGIFRLDGAHGLAGWRWLYLIEGVFTVFCGLVFFFLLPDNYEHAWFLNRADKDLMKARKAHETLYQGKEEFEWSQVHRCFRDYKIWINAIGQFTINVCSLGFSTFLPVIIRAFGYDTLRTQILSVPVYVCASVVYIVVSYSSDKTRYRTFFMVPLALVTTTGYALLHAPAIASTGVRYFACFLCGAGIYICVGLNVTLLQGAAAGYHKRATAIGLQQMLGNTAGFLGSSIYRSQDSPRYQLGSAVSMGAVAIAAAIFTFQGWNYRRLNVARNEMAPEERQRLIDNGAEGDDHPDFRYLW